MVTLLPIISSDRHLEIFELVRLEDERELSYRLDCVSTILYYCW